jgi:DNA repair exonuclease SbcCD ATPase subunit
MTAEEMDAAEKKAALNDDSVSALRMGLAELEAKIKSLREDPVFAEETALSSEVEVLRATIKHRMEEAVKASKSVSEAAAKEETNLSGLRRAYDKATRELGSAKDAELVLKADIASFDEAAAKKDIKYGEEAKKAKPGRDSEKAKLVAQKEEVVVAVSKIDGTITAATTRIEKLKKSLAKLGDKQELPCAECENLVSRGHVEEKIRAAEEEVAAMRKAWEEASKPLAGIKASIAEVDKRLANIEEYAQKGETAARKLVFHENNKASAAVAKKSVDDAAVRQADAAEAVSKSEKALEDLKASARKFSDEAAADTASASAKVSELNAKIADAASRKAVVEARIRTAEREVKDSNDRIGALSAEAAATRSKVEVSRKTAEKVASIARDVAAKTADQARLSIVEAGFGLDGIRVQIIEKYIPLLNVYIDEFLEVVSGKMTMDVITNDKGEIKLKIKGSAASDPRQLSKGQFARVKMATDLALGMMSLARNENAPDFVCLDEVFAPVDVNGKKAMFDVIAKLQEYFRMVVVISHDPFVQEMIKDTIVVNMVNDYSTIERQAHER